MTDGVQDPPSRLRAVLDTSVLLSEHRHWLWLLARLGHYDGVWSTFIVSLNTRDFPPDGELAGVRFVTPRAFLAELASRLPDAGVERLAGEAGRQLP